MARLLAFSLLLILLAACKGNSDIGTGADGSLLAGAAEASDSTTRGVTPGSRAIVLEGYNGTIRLEAAAGANASFTFTRHARGADANQARNRLQKITIEESGDETSYRYRLGSDDANLTSVDIRGQVPAGSSVQIKTANGNVFLSGVTGDVQVEVSNGNVSAAGTTRNVSLKTNSGDVMLGAGALPIEGNVSLQTENGSLSLTMPGSASAKIEAGTRNGAIRLLGLPVLDRKLSPNGAGSNFTGRLGDGSAQVTLRTMNGNIELREGVMLRLPTADTLSIPPADTMRPAPPTAPAPADSAISDTVTLI